MDLETTSRYGHDVRPLVRRLQKAPEDWQRKDLLGLVALDKIRVINLRYPGFDGKLRELRVPITNSAQADRLLAVGERVDGSSLFPGLFESTESDLYVVPVYRWAFLNPWSADELDIVCRFAGKDGAPCPVTPDNVLAAAAEELWTSNRATLKALAELEFYLILSRRDERFTGKAQRNYHQAPPYLHGREIADEILRVVSEVTGCVKYCHGEVGYVDRVDSENPEIDGRRAEQYELEMSLVPVEDLGTWLTVARWLIRVIADRHEASVTFAPKLELDSAGSGMHLHLALEREGRNTMKGAGGALSDDALCMIGGLLGEAAALTALGNTVASSYLRLVPGHEAPTQIRWGRYDRSSLIRVPLDFVTERRLDRAMNPTETGPMPDVGSQTTVEFRSPDGSAFPLLLLAAVTQCVTHGLTGGEGLELARKLEMTVQEAEDRSLNALPASAAEAAIRLRESRVSFEKRGFPSVWIDLVVDKLLQENDRNLAGMLKDLPPEDRALKLRRILHKDLHKH
jgi:glutamine synthetase